MPYMNTVQIKDVQVLDWEVEGIFHVDCYYQAFDYYVVVEDTNGDRWVHEVVFDGRPELVETPEDCYLSRGNMEAAKEAAEALAFRVATRGFINLSHWDFHEFFSLTFEERMDQEYEREQMERYG